MPVHVKPTRKKTALPKAKQTDRHKPKRLVSGSKLFYLGFYTVVADHEYIKASAM
jgi:hypothetical protein